MTSFFLNGRQDLFNVFDQGLLEPFRFLQIDADAAPCHVDADGQDAALQFKDAPQVFLGEESLEVLPERQGQTRIRFRIFPDKRSGELIQFGFGIDAEFRGRFTEGGFGFHLAKVVVGEGVQAVGAPVFVQQRCSQHGIPYRTVYTDAQVTQPANVVGGVEEDLLALIVGNFFLEPLDDAATVQVAAALMPKRQVGVEAVVGYGNSNHIPVGCRPAWAVGH